MKIIVDKHTFNDLFKQNRPDSFTYEGLNALFNHLDTDDNEDLELDVIALDSTYTEYDINDLDDTYSIFDDEDTEDWDADDYANFLNSYTDAFAVGDDSVILEEF